MLFAVEGVSLASSHEPTLPVAVNMARERIVSLVCTEF